MSVLVKDMEMPKNCYQCRMVDSCQYLWKPYDIDDYSDLQNMVEEGFTRADNCPLVEIPPHGRLIDADALEAYTDDKYSLHEIGRVERDCVVDALNYCAPTIIEAEEGE